MARTTDSLLVFSILFLVAGNVASAMTALNEDICKEDSHPEACKKTIEILKQQVQADMTETIRGIIKFSLERSQTLKADMGQWVRLRGVRASEHAALKDCLDALDEGVNDLSKTLKEVDELAAAQEAKDTKNFVFHIQNLQTWLKSYVSTVESCRDDFGMPKLNGHLKDEVLKRLPDVIIPAEISIGIMDVPAQEQ